VEKKDDPQEPLVAFVEWLKADPAHWISFALLIVSIITLIIIVVRRR